MTRQMLELIDKSPRVRHAYYALIGVGYILGVALLLNAIANF